MKISLLHLTDIHMKEDKNWLDNKISLIVNALRIELQNISKCFIIVSGDIANIGSIEEYNRAEVFFAKLKTSLERFCTTTEFQYIFTPGNHDCNINYDTQSRRNSLKRVDYASLGDDQSVINLGLELQKDFWTFYSKFSSLPENKLFYTLTSQVGEKKIRFNCYNTAWMSEKEEKVGNLFYPVDYIKKDQKKSENFDLNVGIFHHPLNWFSPNTEKNNKKELKKYLEDNNSILFFGHEHEEDHTKNTDIKNDRETLYFAGKLLQNNKNNDSGFQIVEIDILENQGTIKSYNYKKEAYLQDTEKSFTIYGSELLNREFATNYSFAKKLNMLLLPLKFEGRERTTLADIYIYPDLEPIDKESKKIDNNYFDSESILLEKDFNTLIIEGETQSGKSSLTHMIYQRYIDLNRYPILLEGRDLMRDDLKKVLERAYNKQYSDNNFAVYYQYFKSGKILLIDNLQDIDYNSNSIIEIIKSLQRLFPQIIITTSSIYNHLSRIESEFENIKCYALKSLGYKKRNSLIEKYHKLSESPLTIDDQNILDKTKHSFNQVQVVLGNKLMPSYPVYILSILQSLNNPTPYNLEQTSYGYCYQALIYVALTKKASIKNEDIDSYFNFLSEFAFHLHQTQKNFFNNTDLAKFYKDYEAKYLAKPLEEIKKNLLSANIFLVDDDDSCYKFCYDYIFYFLVSKKIAELITSEQGKNLIRDLCNNLHIEKNASILILTAHHTKDDFLIDETTFASMTPYDNLQPISLTKDDKFYNLIKEIVKEVSSDIAHSSDPKKERNKMLEANDENERKENNRSQNRPIDDEKYKSMHQAFRAIEIVGQIIKNRKGSLDKEKLTSIITEIYNTGFRTVTHLGNILEETKQDYVQSLRKKIDEGDSKKDIEKIINNFFQLITFQFCLNMFSKLVHAVGNKDLKNLFDDVAKNLNTPAAKLVTFSIKSYYDKISSRELEELAKEFSNNQVALSILRARTSSYLYNNYVDYKKKQRFASILDIKISPRLV